ncbi:restriction endonuclease subunit S [Actinacidiphila alni]|uniref:restriction endonuclease subunit S n=1 Tax=Actinacidiphila alni TaxID=380248 RepID=UPI0034539668
MVRYLRAANVKDGILDLTDVQSMNFTPNEQAIFSLKPGDVLVTEGSGSLTSVGAAAVWRGELDGTICFQNTLLRLRPRAGVDGRYLEWWARAAFGAGVFASIASGANIYHVSAERVRALPISLPSSEEQRRIADFLDAETARIDQMVDLRESQQQILAARYRTVVRDAFAGLSSGLPTRLKYLLKARPRYGVLVPQFVDDGVKFIRVNDLHDLTGRASGLTMIPMGLSKQYSTTILREGDVLVSVVGTLGRAAVVPTSLRGANVNRAIAVLRPRSDVGQELLTAWIGSEEFEAQALLATGNDSAQRTLGMEDMANFRLTWPADPSERDGLVSSISRAQAAIRAVSARVSKQQEVLAERRQALITAAVTGQIDVSTASGRGIES